MAIYDVMFLLNGCSNDSETVDQLKSDILVLKENQEILKKDVKNLESILLAKEEEVEFINMEIDSLHHALNGQEAYFHSRIQEIIRLYGFELEEIMYLVDDFNYDTNVITVKDKYGDSSIYNVSEQCKVLVAGQSNIIYQDLEEGKDFLDSVTKDPGNKVILLFKDGIVEQIHMYGNGSWK